MKIRPLSDRVLIRPASNQEKTKSGIILPETADKEKPEEGEVIAVGVGRLNAKGERMPMEVKAGDRVIFTKYGPNEVKVDDKEYLIAKEEDILAVLEK